MKSIVKKIMLTVFLLSCFICQQNLFAAPASSNNGINPDKLWKNYFATKDLSSVKTMIEYINQDDFLLFMGYEITNREYICGMVMKMDVKSESQKKAMVAQACGAGNFMDLKQAIQKHYPENYQDKLKQAAVISSIIWSLGENRARNKDLDRDIQKMMKDNPKLDYLKKINRAIHS